MAGIPKVKGFHYVVITILISWFLTFLLHERLIPQYSATQCNWTDLKEDSQIMQKDVVTNVLLIADPQLIDNHTYPGRNPFLMKLSQHTVDTYIKKNYKAMVTHLDPDYIFFLGDYLDNGRSSEDDYFYSQLTRFQKVFPYTKYGFKKEKNFLTNVVGNHDIGIGDGVKLKSRTRFLKNFGNPNSVHLINGVEIITLDTLSLMSSDPAINGLTKNFIDTHFFEHVNPRILLSHVPLYRNPKVDTCGPLREGDEFKLIKGYQFQLVVDAEITSQILDKLKPELIFSGDDHDYCDINHGGVSREITVKSISMAMGIWHPAVQLLSFTSTKDQFVYDTKMCYLPTPYHNIAHYVVWAIVSGLMMIYYFVKQSLRMGYSILPTSNSTTSLGTSASKKLSKFVESQDGDSYSFDFIPNYTFTSEPKNPRFYKFLKLCKRYHVFGITKQLALMGLLTTGMYILFCWTI